MDSAYHQFDRVAAGFETYACDGCGAVLPGASRDDAVAAGWRRIDSDDAYRWRCGRCLSAAGPFGGNRHARRAAAATARR